MLTLGKTTRRKRILLVALSVLAGLSPLVLLVARPARAETPSSVTAASNPVTITYSSSVDYATLYYHEYLPNGFNPGAPARLVILLPGVGGNLNNYDGKPEWLAAADNHQFILVTVQPRTLPGYPSSRGTFYMNGALAPGEQDVFDALADERSRRLIDPNRIYIGGYSMGGAGALNLAARNPGVFAAAAPGAPISDLFQEAAYTSTIPSPSLAALLGGMPGQSAYTDTLWYENSARFVLPNLMHTPLTLTHGVSDAIIPNATNVWPYMQSRHIVDTPGFADSRGPVRTLQELAAAWPGGYIAQHAWPPADHGGASLAQYWNPETILSFFDAHPLVTNPITVAFTTYDDQHTHAYWLDMSLTQPWTAQPGLVYAIRNPAQNSVQLQATGSMTLTLDMAPMGLTSAAPLTVVAQPVNGAAPAGDVAVALSGAWPTGGSYSVTKDGVPLPASAYQVQAARFTLLRDTLGVTHTYRIALEGAPPFTPTAWIFLPLIWR